MKIIFLIGILILIISPFMLFFTLDLYPFRYQYIGKETVESEMIVDASKNQYEYLKYDTIGVFDTWTGKIYKDHSALTPYIEMKDLVHKKFEVGIYPPDAEKSVKFSPEQAKREGARAGRLLNKQQQGKKEELLKYILPRQ